MTHRVTFCAIRLKKEENSVRLKKAIKDLITELEKDKDRWPEGFVTKNDTEQELCQKYLRLVSRDSVQKLSCAVCWELHYLSNLKTLISDDPNVLALLQVLKTKGRFNKEACFKFEDPHKHLDDIPLLHTALSLGPTSFIRVCNTCHNSLSKDRVPTRSVSNDLWIGERTDSMKTLSIPAKLLISPIRTKAYITKLKTFGKPNSRQRGVKGMSIAYPQKNSFKPIESKFLPSAISDISELLSIIFVGNKEPTEQQLEKIFSVRVHQIRTVLNEFRSNDHPGFRGDSWNEPAFEELERANQSPLREVFRNNIDVVSELHEKSVEEATASYVPEDGEDLASSQESVILGKTGLINANGIGEKKGSHTGACEKDPLLIPHDAEATSRYYNSKYWVNSFPWLFPFGSGGAEINDRPEELTLKEWVRHLLNLEDPRFRQDPAFMFIVFDVLQRREIYSKTR